MSYGFKVVTIIVVVLLLVWVMLLINTLDAYAHLHFWIDQIEGTY